MIRKAQIKDVDSICNIIHTNLRTVNSVDYSEHVINFMISHYSRDDVLKKIEEKEHFYVFEDKGQILGSLILDNCEAQALYISPDAHGKGVGKKLMTYIEKLRVCDEITLYASESAYIFYEKLGYEFINHDDDPDYGPSRFMKKTFVSTL